MKMESKKKKNGFAKSSFGKNTVSNMRKHFDLEKEKKRLRNK